MLKLDINKPKLEYTHRVRIELPVKFYKILC